LKFEGETTMWRLPRSNKGDPLLTFADLIMGEDTGKEFHTLERTEDFWDSGPRRRE